MENKLPEEDKGLLLFAAHQWVGAAGKVLDEFVCMDLRMHVHIKRKRLNRLTSNFRT